MIVRRARLILAISVFTATLAGGVTSTRAADVLTQHVAGEARASLVRVDPRYALAPQAYTLGPSWVEVSTVGLQRYGGSVGRAWAATADAAVLSANVPVGTSRETEATEGPNTAPEHAQVPGVGSVDVQAQWIDLAAGQCPDPDGNGARVLSDATTSLVEGTVPDAISLEPGVSSSRSTVSLQPVAGAPGLAMHSVAEVNVATIRLLGAYELRIVGQPRLEVVATGAPGGTSVSYAAPIIDVIDLTTGESLGRLDATDTTFDLTPNDNSFHGFEPPLNLRLGAAHNVIATADGRYVRAQADLLQIRSAPGFDWMNLHIGSLAATASAPSGGVTTCDGGAAPAVDRTIPHVLVYELSSGWEHTSIIQASQSIAQIANLTGSFTVEFTNDPSFLRADKLAGIDAIYFNSTTGEFPWSSDQKSLFESWLLCGGGTVGTHAAADANHLRWPLWGELIGAAFQAHPHFGYAPTAGDATVLVEDQDSSVTEAWHGMESFRMADEYYKFRADPRGTQDVKVLLSLDETTVYPWIALGLPIPTFGTSYVHHQPLAWTKTFRGEGRVFYTAFGHNGFAWDRPDFRHHMLRGIEWVTEVRPTATCLTA